MRTKLTYDEIFSARPCLKELRQLERLPIYALVENIRSMHNVGSIFRSSDGARISRLYLSGYTATPPRREIDKTALGSTDSVPWEYGKKSIDIVRGIKKQGVQVVTVEHTSDSIHYTKTDYKFPVCIVMGNEVDGVCEEVVKESDLAIDIPMLGLKQSLNVSVAYGIILYHLLDRYLQQDQLGILI